MKTRFVTLLTVSCLTFPRAIAQDSFPHWVEDAVFYQIFPERFANGDSTNDPPGVEQWGGKPAYNNYFGGDLKGIIDHLDYLQKLGINALYLNPIFVSPTNHKYHTVDYLKIDPHFGDEATFTRLLTECHNRHMHVVIDGVFNHTGRGFFAFDDIIKNEKNSRYLRWYDVHGFPVGPASKPNYEAWWGLGDLPKLMTNNPEVRKYLFDATRFWTSKGLDGWRLDVPNEISHDFWIEWRKLVKGIRPDAYIVGEIWDDASPWLKGDQFDAVMNYRFRGACVGYFALGNTNAAQFDSILSATRKSSPGRTPYVMQNLIGSHDTERFLTLCGGDVSRLKLAALIQMTYVGAPMVYYGDEIGMEGGKDPDCRKTMNWDSTRWNNDLWRWYQKMISVRNSYPVFRRGAISRLLAESSTNVFGFMREDDSLRAAVLVNPSDSDRRIPGTLLAQAGNRWFDILARKPIGAGDITLPSRSGLVLISTKGM